MTEKEKMTKKCDKNNPTMCYMLKKEYEFWLILE